MRRLVEERPHSGLHQLCIEFALGRRIERTLFRLKLIVGPPLHFLNQGRAMGRPAVQRLEEHEFECAGKQVASGSL
jgi:hypothetical protein